MIASAASLALLGSLAGCADGTSGDPAAGAEPSAQHTMADGTVMSGAEHDSGGHEHGEDSGGDESAADVPSATALMVCGGDVAADVQRLLDLAEPPESSYSWAAPVFECTYDTPSGPLVLLVHDAARETDGQRWFERTRARLAPTQELKGIYGLGLPAFETGRGEAVFIREGKTLVVDATVLPASMGPAGDMDPADLAYAVATSVLACWTDHA